MCPEMKQLALAAALLIQQVPPLELPAPDPTAAPEKPVVICREILGVADWVCRRACDAGDATHVLFGKKLIPCSALPTTDLEA